MQSCAATIEPAQPMLVQPEPVQYQPQSNCREFTATVMVAGKSQEAFGNACQQPDGTWQITQNTPGSPAQVYTLPSTAIYVGPDPDFYYWNGPPFFVGGSIFFADRFGRFHGGFHPRFHARFHEGFHGGFHGGDHHH
jgi:surface antigen